MHTCPPVHGAYFTQIWQCAELNDDGNNTMWPVNFNQWDMHALQRWSTPTQWQLMIEQQRFTLSQHEVDIDCQWPAGLPPPAADR